MTGTIPSHYRLAYNSELIAKRVEQLGKQITAWAAEDPHDQILAICVLRGAAHFFSDLVRSISISIEPAFCRTWSYSSVVNEQHQSGVRVSVESVMAQGRRILVVDDICDTGATLLKLEKVFTDLGAKEIRSAVLIHRQVENSEFIPTWSGFEYQGTEWFVGYGMEDKNHFTNLSAVYTILPHS